MRDEKHCFFHLRFQPKNLGDSKLSRLRGTFMLPILEDANSIQVALADVMRMIFMQQIDHRSAALMLYALQTASANVRATSLEPEMPTRVVIDRECVERRPIGATAWSTVAGREYDEMTEELAKKKDSKAEIAKDSRVERRINHISLRSDSREQLPEDSPQDLQADVPKHLSDDLLGKDEGANGKTLLKAQGRRLRTQ
ncbi:MAG: hypothetical protein LAO30_13375 [Acidobacteriia bacterium]|nr:hypothetical protein [Terriglobia bacterium]